MTLPQYQCLDLNLNAAGVLVMTMRTGLTNNAMNEVLHRELAEVWPRLKQETGVRSILLRGENGAFGSGGDLEWVRRLSEKMHTPEGRADFSDFDELLAIPLGMMNLDKPIVAQIEGPAVAGGLATALMADITITATNAVLCDGHVRGGIVAGDHAALIWPLLCGMAKAKYYLLTGRSLSGAEAERIGLVSMAVPPPELEKTATQVATNLARGPQIAIGWTKRSLNGWLRMAQPIFEHSAALERLSFAHPDMIEGLDALMAGRKPTYR